MIKQNTLTEIKDLLTETSALIDKLNLKEEQCHILGIRIEGQAFEGTRLVDIHMVLDDKHLIDTLTTCADKVEYEEHIVKNENRLFRTFIFGKIHITNLIITTLDDTKKGE